MPFLEISHSAKVSTVVGSIDLSQLTDKDGPVAAVLPGTLAQAHRGVVLVDEINRLADTAPEIADVLLDVMGTKPGRLQIEETGLPKVEIPVNVTVWAASNPDEDPGPLDGIRRQLSDRFDMCVGVQRPTEVHVLSRALRLSNSPYKGAMEQDYHDERETRETLTDKSRAVSSCELSPQIIEFVAKLYVDYSLESIRSVESILYAARMHCTRRGGHSIERQDVESVSPLALRHRVSAESLSELMAALKETKAVAAESEPIEAEEPEHRDAAGNYGAQSSLLSRLIDAFKEPRFEQQDAQKGLVPYVPSYTEQELRGRKEVPKASGSVSAPEPEVVKMQSPPLAARELSSIPFAERIRAEDELL
jgi:magnesium chelatase subunit I